MVLGVGRDYLMSLTNASVGGVLPISCGSRGEEVDSSTATWLVDAGCEIIGDLQSQAPEGLTAMYRNGGSLEQGVADTDLLESADEHSLVSIWWRGRMDDLGMREDKEVIS